MKNILATTATLLFTLSAAAATNPCSEGWGLKAADFAKPGQGYEGTHNMDVPATDPRCEDKPLYAPLSFPTNIEIISVNIEAAGDFQCVLEGMEQITRVRQGERQERKIVNVRVIERTEDDGGCRVTLNTLDGKQAIVDLVVHPD
jgi:hypothetical protein